MKYITKINILSKLIWVIFGITLFVLLYIRATTNRLYRPDVDNFLLPIYQNLIILLIVSPITILFIDVKNKRLIEGAKYIGITIALMSFFVELFDFAPCFHRHSSSLTEHAHPHTISYTLKHSFLCPSFSHSSRFILFIIFIIGSCIAATFYFIEKWGETKK